MSALSSAITYIKTHFPLLQYVDGKVCMLAAQLQQGFNQNGGVPINVDAIMLVLADGLATLAYKKVLSDWPKDFMGTTATFWSHR